jgi:hypothetical protein
MLPGGGACDKAKKDRPGGLSHGDVARGRRQ